MPRVLTSCNIHAAYKLRCFTNHDDPLFIQIDQRLRDINELLLHGFRYCHCHTYLHKAMNLYQKIIIVVEMIRKNSKNEKVLAVGPLCGFVTIIF